MHRADVSEEVGAHIRFISFRLIVSPHELMPNCWPGRLVRLESRRESDICI